MPDRGSELLPLRLLRRPLIGIIAIALGGMVLWALQKACAGISFDAMVAALRATSPVAPRVTRSNISELYRSGRV